MREKAIIRKRQDLVYAVAVIMVIGLLMLFSNPSQASTAGEINSDVQSALKNLYRTTPAAEIMAKSAKGILVFPSVVKGGFVFGGQYGEGALLVNGKTSGYYSTLAASYGLQIGVQTFGYALFFLDNEGLSYLNKSDGWEIGVGPNIVVMDEGAASALTSTTVRSGVYAFFFNQKGLMAGISIEGSKITRVIPDE